MAPKPKVGVAEPTPKGGLFSSRTFIVVLAAMAVLGLHGAGVLDKLDTTTLGLIVSLFVGGEKAADTVGRYVTKSRH